MCILAPYEADFQLAQMFKKSVVDYIWSEDSDILVYDCWNVIKGVKSKYSCQVLDEKILNAFTKKVESNKITRLVTKCRKTVKFFSLSPVDKIKVGIYSGCDYLSNIKGFGFGTVIDYFPKDETKLRKKMK